MRYSELDLPDGYWMLYVLKLRHNYHYVGVTTNLKQRFARHDSGDGASATRQHKPLKLEAVYHLGYMSYLEAEKYEDAYTLSMILKHGDKWLGGRFCNGCKQKKAKQLYDGIDKKYKGELTVYPYHYTFKVQKERKRRRKKRNEMKAQIAKAQHENAKVIRQRFGTL